MTNYGWLKQHGYVDAFTHFLMNKNVDELKRRYGFSDEDVYDISGWLKSERKVEH